MTPTASILATLNFEAWPWLIDTTLKATFVLVVAALAARCLRNSAARLRATLWTAALCAVAVMPLLAAITPGWKLGILPEFLSPHAPGLPVVATAGTEQAPQAGRQIDRAVWVSHVNQPDQAALAREPVFGPAPAPSRVATAPQRSDQPTTGFAQPETSIAGTLTYSWWPLALWLSGAVAVLSCLAVGVARANALARRALPAVDTVWADVLADLSAHLQLPRPTRLLIGRHADTPMTFGWLRPVVLLPADAAGWSPQRRRIVLAHELMHIKRCDWLMQLCCRVACALYWFNPLMWIAIGRHAVESDRACDEGVIALGTRPSDYVMHVVEIAQRISARAAAPMATLAMARRSQLEIRMLSVLTRRPLRRHGFSSLIVVASSMSLAAALLAGAQLWREAPPAPPMPDAPLPAPAPLADPAPVWDAPDAPPAPTSPLPDTRPVPAPPAPQAMSAAPDPRPAPRADAAPIAEPGPMPAPRPHARPDSRPKAPAPPTPTHGHRHHSHDSHALPAHTHDLVAAAIGHEVAAEVAKAKLGSVFLLTDEEQDKDDVRGDWKATIKGGDSQLRFESRGAWGQMNTTLELDGRDIKSLEDLDFGAVDFELDRDAGTFAFIGKRRGASASGSAIFTMNRRFTRALSRATRADFTVMHALMLAAQDFSTEDLEALDELGYGDIDADTLSSFVIHGVTVDFIRDMRRADITDLSADELVSMRIHGVDGDYVRGLRTSGLKDVSTDNIIAASIHGVSVDYVQGMGQVGYEDLTVDDVISMRIHGVTADFVRSMYDLGYRSLSTDDLISMRIHGIQADYVEAWMDAGYKSLDVDELVSLAIHGVSREFTRELQDLGIPQLDIDELLSMRIHGITPSYIKNMRRLARRDLSTDEMVGLRIHGVQPEFLAELADIGYTDISIDDVLALRIHGVQTDFIDAIQDLGYENIKIDDLVALRIHGVTPKMIRGMQRSSDERLSVDRIIEKVIHGDY